MKNVHNSYTLTERRKELRKNQTKAEQILWWYLKGERLGIKFRRQHSIGGYILDFICKEKRLIIELDGEIHNKKENKEYDTIRDKYFIELEYSVLRFSNKQIEESIKEVIEKIKSYM